MFFSERFICASKEKNEYEKQINAPLFKREFDLQVKAKGRIQICGLGFYRIFLNGKELTKGRLAPYISNTDQAVYYDEYKVDKYLRKGKNLLSVLLGNGLQNGIGGEIFGFQKGSWVSSPKFALSFFFNDKLLFEADESFLWCNSPIIFDDLWAGEHYDARLECMQNWQKAIPATTPKGEKRESSNLKVRVERKVRPIKVFPYKNGYIYDFGLNTAGVCRLKVKANAGQKISLYYFEIFHNGEICTENISFGKRTRENYWQRDEYITKDGVNVYEPSFTYHGFQYVYVEGLTEKQATKSALTMLTFTASVKNALKFSCSDKRIEKLFSMVINSNKSNFLYYPTDCPHREKNGWTGDAMLSAEQMLLSADYDEYLKEWLFCLRKAQRENGQLPRIVPSTEWGFDSGASGPNWDGALIEITYQLFRKNGDKTLLTENLPAIERYLVYLSQKRNEKGLISYGLGDREETFTNESSAHSTPNEVTDTLVAIELCQKTKEMALEAGNANLLDFSQEFENELKTAFKLYRVDCDYKVIPFTQTGQCMLLSAKVFNGEEEKIAKSNFINLLKSDGVVKMGVLGYRRLFDTLAEIGETQLACKLLLTENYSGYLYYVKKGMNSMPESFLDYLDGSFVRKDGGKMLGLNHHWYGHILASIVKYVLGIRSFDIKENKLFISPCFIDGIKKMSVKSELGGRKINFSWIKNTKCVKLRLKTNFSTVDFNLNGEKQEIKNKKGIIKISKRIG